MYNIPRPLYVHSQGKNKQQHHFFFLFFLKRRRQNKFTFNITNCFSTSSKYTCIVKDDNLINALTKKERKQLKTCFDLQRKYTNNRVT